MVEWVFHPGFGLPNSAGTWELTAEKRKFVGSNLTSPDLLSLVKRVRKVA